MRLVKAIQIKENYLKLHSRELYKEVIEADRLGIEALKRLKALREHLFSARHPLLPGETKGGG